MVRLNIRIRNLLFVSILNQEIGFFDSIRTGKLVVLPYRYIYYSANFVPLQCYCCWDQRWLLPGGSGETQHPDQKPSV